MTNADFSYMPVSLLFCLPCIYNSTCRVSEAITLLRCETDFLAAVFNMITQVYSHILDKDRKVNAQKFEAAFYSNPDIRDVKPPPLESSSAFDIQALLAELQSNPALAATLSQILSDQKS